MSQINDDYVDATCFLQIEPEFVGSGDSLRVKTAKVVNMTQQRPHGRQKAGTIMSPVTFRIPKAAFMPLSPRVVVVIPEDMITAVPIEVEASDGTDG